MARRSTVERREGKYPDTEVFKYYNANPKNNFVGDCVARAISKATGNSWECVIRDMTEYGIKHGTTFNDKKNIRSYLKSLGWVKHSEPRDRNNKKVIAKDFLKDNHIRKAIANVGSHHIVAIEDGKIVDTWNSSYETIHSYWTPPVSDQKVFYY